MEFQSLFSWKGAGLRDLLVRKQNHRSLNPCFRGRVLDSVGAVADYAHQGLNPCFRGSVLDS